jgi:hypothetical protein
MIVDDRASNDTETSRLILEIKILISKGDHATKKAEQFYISAGLNLKKLKARKPDSIAWGKFVRDTCGLGQARADELIRIADGKTTVDEVRAATAARMRKSRQRSMSRDTDEADDEPQQDDVPEQDDSPLYDEAPEHESDDEPSKQPPKGEDVDSLIHDLQQAIEDNTHRIRAWAKSHDRSIDAPDRYQIANCMRSCGEDLLSMAAALEEPPTRSPARKERPQRQQRNQGH